MAINFKNTPLEWANKGTEPTNEVKQDGFKVGYAPPAEYHNYMFANAFDSIKELQTATSTADDSIANLEIGKVDKTQYASHSQLGVVKFRTSSNKNYSGIREFGNGVIGINANSKKGLSISGSNELITVAASEDDIASKTNKYNPIVPSNLDYAVQAVTGQLADLTTNEKATFTEAINWLHTILSDVETEANQNENRIIALEESKTNIKENPDATGGDILSTHLTIGSRLNDSYKNLTLTSGEDLTVGFCSAAIGCSASLTSGDYNVICGGTDNFIVTSDYCFIGGGLNNKIQDTSSAIVGGEDNTVTATTAAIIGGEDSTASGTNSVVIGGAANIASGEASVVLGGEGNTALEHQIKGGHYAKDGTAAFSYGTTGDALALGNGTSTAKSNCFRVDYAGGVYGLTSFKGSGADYAEYFEWLDGNPNGTDRRGIFVTVDGEKIRPATADDDYILGVVSAMPSICGDTQSEVWQGMYKRDVFGAYEKDADGNMIVSADYDNSKEYISREHRPEWAAVGMLGKLVVCDDGTCQANGYCTAGENGIATATATGYRVLSRIDDKHVKILLK